MLSRASSPFAGILHDHYKVILADPPWTFKTWSTKGDGRSANQHYACMSLADLAALPVADIAAPDAVLFLWVIQSMLPEAMELLRSWGFQYKTVAFCWVKPHIGLGYHTRAGMEQCWLATKGKGYQRVGKGVRQVLHAPKREHSRKPDEIYERIEALVGDVPRIELFARARRENWTTWGDEI